MSKYQALIDALAGVNGQLGQPSLHSGHVIYAETEEWCSVDINVKLAANKHISGPLARFIKEAANPATIRALLADLERAEKALKAVAAWGPFPRVPDSYSDEPGATVSYAVAFGSNGERDYIRGIAQVALAQMAGG